MAGRLNHSPAEVAQVLLVDLGMATLPLSSGAWPVYYSKHPDTPDDSICIYNTDGRLFGRTQVDGEIQMQHGLQFRIRANTPAGYAKASEIAHALDTEVLRTVVDVDGSDYLVQSITRIGDVIPLGDELGSRRKLWTINALMALRMLATTGTG